MLNFVIIYLVFAWKKKSFGLINSALTYYFTLLDYSPNSILLVDIILLFFKRK